MSHEIRIIHNIFFNHHFFYCYGYKHLRLQTKVLNNPWPNYFWTATINQWQYLLQDDQYKNVIIDSLKHLSEKGKVDVFVFVIRPNHIHLIWQIKTMNGKEKPHVSFLKYTDHEFRKMLLTEDKGRLARYAGQSRNKEHELWKRDSLAVYLYTSPVAYQKMNYIHRNLISKPWKFVENSCDY